MDPPTLRALVVDDEEAIRRLVKRSLGRHGIHCDCASSGSEALGLLQTRSYHIAIIDLRMPQIHGHSLCRTLLARKDRPIIVVLTGVREPRLADDLTTRGVDKIFFKPVNFRDFSDEVCRLLLNRPGLRQPPPPAVTALPAPPAAQRTVDQTIQAPPVRAVSAPLPARAVSVSEARSDRQLVGVLRHTPARSAFLAERLRAAELDAVAIASADALRRLLETRSVHLLVLDHRIEGFFTGLEIVRKLRAAGLRVPVLLVDSNERLLAEQSPPPALVTLVNSRATDAEIAETARRVLSPQEPQGDISDRARALVASQGEWPLLSRLCLQLLEYLEMAPEEVPVKELCRDVSLDPKAAAVLLKAANASTNGLLQEIGSVPDAVRVLGVRPTIGRILNAAMTDGIGSLSNALPSDLQTWHTRRAMLLASTASTFATELEGGSSETAFLIGILQDVGLLCLLHACPEEYGAVLKRWRAVGHLKLGAIEQSMVGCTHAEVSAAMMERWHMPRSLVDPVLHHLDTPAIAARSGIEAGLQRLITIAEALVDLTDAPHAKRRYILNAMLAPYGLAKKAACVRSVALASARAAEAFQLTTLPLPSAAEIEAMVCSALSEESPANDSAEAAAVSQGEDSTEDAAAPDSFERQT